MLQSPVTFSQYPKLWYEYAGKNIVLLGVTEELTDGHVALATKYLQVDDVDLIKQREVVSIQTTNWPLEISMTEIDAVFSNSNVSIKSSIDLWIVVKSPAYQVQKKLSVMFIDKRGNGQLVLKLRNGLPYPQIYPCAVKADNVPGIGVLEWPERITYGSLGSSWHYLLESHVSTVGNWEASTSLETVTLIAKEIEKALSFSNVGYIHGDFTPWNVKQTHYGVAVLDWEDVKEGEFGDDVMRFVLCSKNLKLLNGLAGSRSFKLRSMLKFLKSDLSALINGNSMWAKRVILIRLVKTVYVILLSYAVKIRNRLKCM